MNKLRGLSFLMCLLLICSIVAASSPFADSGNVSGLVKAKSGTASVKAANPPKSSPSNANQTKVVEIVVRPGDCLYKIAARMLGLGRLWPKLVEWNADRYPSLLKNPDLIHTGWRLILKLGPNTPPSIVSPRPGSSTGNAGNTGNTGNTSGNTTPTQTEMVSGSAPAPKPCPKPKGNAVTAKSPGFNKWLDDALREYGDWDMPVFKNKYGETITPRDYVKAIIHIESSGIHRKSNGAIITSCCGAQGFMQLMPDTAKYLKIANPADPAQNILGGVKLFKQIFTSRYIGKKSGLEKLIMAGCAYNIGPYSKKLANSWESNLANNRGAVGYGLKLKMSLGFKLTAQERDYVAKHMARGKSVDAYADSQYAYAKGIGM